MKRRTFIKNSSLAVMSTSAFGSIHWNGENFAGNSPTTTDILGPFYRPGAPMRSNIVPPNSKGIPMSLNGTIFKEDGKTSLNNVLVEIWQCDENEYYDNASDDYLFRGTTMTGTNGQYTFDTIVPVPYKANPNNDNSWRPAHIHMRVSIPGQQDLVTQIYFKGDKYIDKDTWASSPKAINRILKVEKNLAGENAVTFDVVMNKEFPLEKEVYNKITGLYKTDNDRIIEFIQSDDLLLMKRNGQFVTSFKYIGDNTFEGGIGNPKVRFELSPNGGSKVIVGSENNSYTGEKYLKY